MNKRQYLGTFLNQKRSIEKIFIKMKSLFIKQSLNQIVKS